MTMQAPRVMDLESALSGLNEATVSDQFPKLEPNGKYVIKVVSFDIRADTYESGLTAIIEMECVKTTNPDILVGSVYGQTITKLDGPDKKLKLGNLKNFLASAGGISEDAPNVNWIALAAECVKTQGLNGRLVAVQCDPQKIAKKSGKPYTPTKFFPYTGE